MKSTQDGPGAVSSRAQDAVRRLAGKGGASAPDTLRGVAVAPTELEGFRPLNECLEWRLADVYWDRAGVIPFVRNDVPYLVNNTGRLSESAAALVFAALDEMRTSLPARVTILELGAGTGLHARYFLDAFSALCRAEGSDLYDRLLFVVTDRYERTVHGWQEVGLFEDHQAHVALRVCDATAPGELTIPGGGTGAVGGAPMVVFCNYLLDVLPSRIVHRVADGLQQLCVRTHYVGGAAGLKIAGIESLEVARALASSSRVEDLSRLLPLLPQLELETAALPWTPATEADAELAAAISGDGRVIINFAALECLRNILELISEGGLVLVNDYGPVRDEDVVKHLTVQRFGGSVALGLNFPLLERVLAARGVSVVAAEGDAERRVHTRLLARTIGGRSRDTFRDRFRLEHDRYLDAPLDEARAHVAAGRTNEALAAYRLLIERSPGDWQMLGEAAEYVGLQLRDYAAGMELARSALERNPWCSSWLWNILGDCLFCGEKYDDAHDAFLEARRVDPEDPRTNLNLAYTLSLRGAQDEALTAIAKGLAQDGRGRAAYRTRLLEKQGQILGLLTERAAWEQERLIKRTEKFR